MKFLFVDLDRRDCVDEMKAFFEKLRMPILNKEEEKMSLFDRIGG